MESEKATDAADKKDNRKRVRSPEELDAYIRLVRPGTMLLIGAFTLIVVALIVWGVTGKLPVTVSGKGVLYSEYYRLASEAIVAGKEEEFRETTALLSDEDRSSLEQPYVYCFLDAYQYNRDELEDKKVAITYPGKQPVQGRVVGVTADPYTKDMITREFNTSFIADTCASSDYSWVLQVETSEPIDSYRGALMDTTIEIGQVQPISMLFR